MKKTEFAVGEIFQFGLKKLQVFEVYYDEAPSCEHCALCGTYCGLLSDFLGECDKCNRSDKKEVIFREVEDEE